MYTPHVHALIHTIKEIYNLRREDYKRSWREKEGGMKIVEIQHCVWNSQNIKTKKQNSFVNVLSPVNVDLYTHITHALPGIILKGFSGKTGLSGESLRLDLLCIEISHMENTWYFRRGQMFKDFHWGRAWGSGHKFGQLRARGLRRVKVAFPKVSHHTQIPTKISTLFIHVNLHYKNSYLYTLYVAERKVQSVSSVHRPTASVDTTRAVCWSGVSCSLHSTSRHSKAHR